MNILNNSNFLRNVLTQNFCFSLEVSTHDHKAKTVKEASAEKFGPLSQLRKPFSKYFKRRLS